MGLSLRAAAKEVGVAKSTILRAIDVGKITATQNPNNRQYEIEPAELFRVYKPVPGLHAPGNLGDIHGSGYVAREAPPPLRDPIARQIAAAESELVERAHRIEMLELRLAEAERRATEAAQERDRWHESFRTQQLLLGNEEGAKPRRRGVFGIFRKIPDVP